MSETDSASAQDAGKAPGVTLPNGRKYETFVLTFSRYDGDAIQEINGAVKKTIEDAGGVNIEVQVFGRRKLAYVIQGQADGVYVNFTYDALPAVANKIDATLGVNETLIRHFTTAVGSL